MRNSEMLPVYGGFDYNGNLTCSPDEIIKSRRPLPIGYWKGSGLSIMLDLLTTLLSKGRSTYMLGELEEEYGVSQVFICFDIIHLHGSSFVDHVIEEMIDFIHGTTPSGENQSVYYPGERTLLARKLNREKGIPVGLGDVRDETSKQIQHQRILWMVFLWKYIRRNQNRKGTRFRAQNVFQQVISAPCLMPHPQPSWLPHPQKEGEDRRVWNASDMRRPLQTPGPGPRLPDW
jgi:hypothetical protein